LTLVLASLIVWTCEYSAKSNESHESGIGVRKLTDGSFIVVVESYFGFRIRFAIRLVLDRGRGTGHVLSFEVSK
jgi:hypothetical protein